jgi:hypothetical protein
MVSMEIEVFVIVGLIMLDLVLARSIYELLDKWK